MDQCISRPDVIGAQVGAKRAELQAQGDDLNGEITRAQGKLTETDQEREFVIRQGKRGKITEAEFDREMDRYASDRAYWLGEIERLKELRDNACKVDAGLNYANQFLASLREGIGDLDMTPGELNKLSAEDREHVMQGRRKIVLALCETVYVYANNDIKIEGALDGSEAAQFEFPHSWQRMCPHCIRFLDIAQGAVPGLWMSTFLPGRRMCAIMRSHLFSCRYCQWLLPAHLTMYLPAERGAIC